MVLWHPMTPKENQNCTNVQQVTDKIGSDPLKNIRKVIYLFEFAGTMSPSEVAQKVKPKILNFDLSSNNKTIGFF